MRARGTVNAALPPDDVVNVDADAANGAIIIQKRVAISESIRSPSVLYKI